MARRNEQQWKALIERQRESGQSAVAFCRQQDISPTYFSSKKRLLVEQQTTRFLKVIPKPKRLSADDAQCGDRHSGAGPALNRLRIIDLDLGVGMDVQALALVLDKVLR